MKKYPYSLFAVMFIMGSVVGYVVGSNKEKANIANDPTQLTMTPASQKTRSSTSSIHSQLNRGTRSSGSHENSRSKPDSRQLILQADGSFIVPKEEVHRITTNLCDSLGQLSLKECKKIGLTETQITDLSELHNQHLEREKKRQADEATILCEKDHFRALHIPPNTQLFSWGQEYSERAARILTDHVSMTLPQLSQSLGYVNDPTKMERVILIEDDGSGTCAHSIIEYSNPIDVELFQNAQEPKDFRKGAYSIRKITSNQTPEVLRHIFKD